jgi:hypothetical protein
MVTSAKAWKGKTESGNLELKLPSGNVALVQRLQPEAFLSSGMIPDSLSGMVNEAIRSKKGLPPNAQKVIASDPKKLRQAMQMTDEIVCWVVVEPRCEMPPRCAFEFEGQTCNEYFDTDDKRHQDHNNPGWHGFTEGERDEDVLYVDEVSLEDKNFIFQFAVGGTADVERFREELRRGVVGVPNGKGKSRKAKRTPGDR